MLSKLMMHNFDLITVCKRFDLHVVKAYFQLSSNVFTNTSRFWTFWVPLAYSTAIQCLRRKTLPSTGTKSLTFCSPVCPKKQHALMLKLQDMGRSQWMMSHRDQRESQQ